MRHSRNVNRIGFVSALILVIYAGVVVAGQQADITPVMSVSSVDYNWDVKPILSENCFLCHGPSQQQAGLRLDDARSAMAVIVPGSPETSEFVRRINSDNDFERMPAAESNKRLTPDQIAILERWIAEGAEYKPHWAFTTPERAPLPTTPSNRTANWTGNEIDRFVVARLDQEGLEPSEEADPETLYQPRQPDTDRSAANARRSRCVCGRFEC